MYKTIVRTYALIVTVLLLSACSNTSSKEQLQWIHTKLDGSRTLNDEIVYSEPSEWSPNANKPEGGYLHNIAYYPYGVQRDGLVCVICEKLDPNTFPTKTVYEKIIQNMSKSKEDISGFEIVKIDDCDAAKAHTKMLIDDTYDTIVYCLIYNQKLYSFIFCEKDKLSENMISFSKQMATTIHVVDEPETEQEAEVEESPRSEESAVQNNRSDETSQDKDEPENKDENNSEIESEKKQPDSNEPDDKDSKKDDSNKTRRISELEFDGELVTVTAAKDMKEGYSYIKDVYIDPKEDEEQINITIQVPASIKENVAKMAGEDVARYLASLASFANSYYEVPGSDDIGSLYDHYSLMIYIDDGNQNVEIWGAKVKEAKSITWK